MRFYKNRVRLDNIPYNATKIGLIISYRKFGVIMSKIFFINRKGRFSGSAFATVTGSDINKFIQDFNGVEILGRPIYIVKASDDK